MPKILTEKYLESTFFVPYASDKSEGVWVKPLSQTKRNAIRQNSIQEAGHDVSIAEDFVLFETLKICITDWKGFYDVKGLEIPYTPEILKECMRCNMEFFNQMYIRILAVATFGELEQEKN